jgi:PAS domain S-box-containing protein
MIEFIIGLSIQQIAAWLFVFITVAALIKPVRTRAIKLYNKFFPARALLMQHLEESEDRLSQIYAELRPNGSTSLRDAVDRIETEQKYQRDFQLAQLNVNDNAAFKTDSEGHFQYVNRRFQRLLGYSSIESLGDGWINAVEPSSRDETFRKWQEAILANREFSEDITFIRSNGELLEGHINTYPIGINDGFLGVISVPKDCPYRSTCYSELLQYVNSQKER